MRNFAIATLVVLSLLFKVNSGNADKDQAPPGVDLDIRSAVVRVYADSKMTGLGVVVGQTGEVLVAFESVKAALPSKVTSPDGKTVTTIPGKQLEIAAGYGRKSAHMVAFDTEHGAALVRMNGVIPRPARLDMNGPRIGAHLQLVGTYLELDRDTYPMPSSAYAYVVAEAKGKHPIPAEVGGKTVAKMVKTDALCVGTPAFNPKSGALSGIDIRAAGDDGEYAVIVPLRDLRELLTGLSPAVIGR